MLDIKHDTELTIRDLRIKTIELVIFTITAFSLLLFSTQNQKIKWVLISFILLIVYQVVILLVNANKTRQERVLRNGELSEDVKLTYISYPLEIWDYIGLVWYTLSILASALIMIYYP